MRHQHLIPLLSVALLAGSCATGPYQAVQVSRERLLVDSRYDAHPDAEAARFLAPFRQKVDSMMSPVVGRAACYMAADRPEAKLSNLLPDILMWASSQFGEQPDFAVYNMGGIRAAIAEGDITIGNVLDVAPFENKIFFLTLSGEKVTELFGQMAHRGGECVSHGVRLEITKDGRLLSATLHGQPIDPLKAYRVATLDYVAQGNDQLSAFKSGTQMVAPSGEQNNVRHLIVAYMKEQMAKGVAVDPKIEGRITVK